MPAPADKKQCHPDIGLSAAIRMALFSSGKWLLGGGSLAGDGAGGGIVDHENRSFAVGEGIGGQAVDDT